MVFVVCVWCGSGLACTGTKAEHKARLSRHASSIPTSSTAHHPARRLQARNMAAVSGSTVAHCLEPLAVLSILHICHV